MQILILGMHRSGTSLATRLVNMMGAYFGPEGSVGEITIDNPKGFWERPEVFKLNDAILASRGCSWYDLRRWRFNDAPEIPEKLVKHLQKLVLGMDAFRPWVLKDPRMCLLLPAWRPYLEIPVAVIVHRNPIEIALSLQKRDGLPVEYGVALWEHYAVSLLTATQDIPRIFVRHADLLQKPVKTTQMVFEKLNSMGVRRLEMPTAKEIQAFIDPALYRSKNDGTNTFKITPGQKALTEMMVGLRPQPDVIRVTERSHAIIRKALTKPE